MRHAPALAIGRRAHADTHTRSDLTLRVGGEDALTERERQAEILRRAHMAMAVVTDVFDLENPNPGGGAPPKEEYAAAKKLVTAVRAMEEEVQRREAASGAACAIGEAAEVEVSKLRPFTSESASTVG